MTSSFVTCSYCSRNFLKDNRHINENLKLHNNFYCSAQCQYSAKTKSRDLICEDPSCKNKFKRTPSTTSFRNFCSQTCYGKLVSLRNESRNKSFKYCLYCGSRIDRLHTYCSPKCWGLHHQKSKKEIIKGLQKLAHNLGRTPTKRECSFNNTCFKQFNSWNNALISAGLIPHRSLNQRMYKRRKCVAKDGHICNSVSELIIDNWLYKNNIDHQKETPYPKGKFIADWSLSNNIFVEYFGLAQDSRRYDEEIKKKQQICKDSKVTLIEIYSKDLFPKNRLEEILS